jgi:hypothetical protein
VRSHWSWEKGNWYKIKKQAGKERVKDGMADRGVQSRKEAGEQEVMRSRVTDEEIWRQRSERFNVVAAAAGKQKIRRSG